MGKLEIEKEPREIVEEAIEKILDKHNVKGISELVDKIGFSSLLDQIEEEAYRIYRIEEKRAVRNYLEKNFGKRLIIV